MKKTYSALLKCSLFEGMTAMEIESMLKCLSAREKKYKKEEAIFLTGDEVSDVGAVLSGRVIVVREDRTGAREILAHAEEGGIFAESIACSHLKILPVSVFCAADAEVLFLDARKILRSCPSACGFHNRLIQNVVALLADKNLSLSQKLEIVSKKTTREKLLSYLWEEGQRSGKERFTIPFDRQQLADYLSVDRSAMSRELSRLSAEGILSYHKNEFFFPHQN